MKTVYKEVYIVDVSNDNIKHIFDDISLAEKYRNEQISVGRDVSDIHTEFMPFAVEEKDLKKEIHKQICDEIRNYIDNKIYDRFGDQDVDYLTIDLEEFEDLLKNLEQVKG